MPRWVRFLGFAGLLPVIAGVTSAIAHPARDIQLISAAASLLYGGLILSFIGGAWWGLAAQKADGEQLKQWLVLSVLPSLYAWVVVAYAWIVAAFAQAAFLIAVGFVLTLLVDRKLAAARLAPLWWMGLRKPLSFTMALLFVTLCAETLL